MKYNWMIEPPDELLPVQWHTPTTIASERPGEYRFMLAILESAVDDITRMCPDPVVCPAAHKQWARDREGALCWVFMEPSGAAIEFRECCELLGIDADWTRAKIERVYEVSRGE